MLAERVRGRLAPVVALLASSLLMCCLVTLPDQSIGWPGLGTASARFVGWAGFALGRQRPCWVWRCPGM